MLLKPFQSGRINAVVARCLAALLGGISVPPACAATYYWDNNGATAGFGAAGGTWAVPTLGNASQGWSTSSGGTLVPGNVTTTAADDVNFGAATLALGAGTVTISGNVTNNSLTFGSASDPITISGGTAVTLGGASPSISVQNNGNTLSTPILFTPSSGSGEISFSLPVGGSVGTLSVNGGIRGTGGVTFTTPNVVSGNWIQRVSLGAACTYSGTTTITSGNINNSTLIENGVDNALPTNTVLTIDGGDGAGSGRSCIYDLNGHNQTLAGLASVTGLTLRSQRVVNSSATAATLTLTEDSTRTFSGVVGWTGTIPGSGGITTTPNISVVMNGSGTCIFAGNNQYSGNTTISSGTLQLGGGGTLGGGSYAGSIVTHGTFNYASSAAQSLTGALAGSGTLTCSGSGTLTLTGTNALPGTILSGGTFAVSGSGLVTGAVNVNAGGTVSLTGGGRANVVTVNNGGTVRLPNFGIATHLICASGSAMSFDFSTGTNVGSLTVIAPGGITNSGAANSVTLNLTGAVPTNGTYALINYSGNLQGTGFGAYKLGAVPFGKSYTLSNAPGAVQVIVGTAPDFVQVETRADGTGVAVSDTTVQTGTSLTNYAILRTGTGVFLTNLPATWGLTNVTGAVASSNLVVTGGGRSALFTPVGVGAARLLATVPGMNALPSGTITSILSTSRPFIWVRDSEKAGILAKIATNAWATSLYNSLVARTAPNVASHQADRDGFLRGLPVNWTAATPVFIPTSPPYDDGEAYFNIALDCAVLFYLTGDTDYARCAADILHNSVQAFQNLAPSTSAGNGGWLIPSDLLYEARQVGCQLPVVYDFLYAYLQGNQVYDVDAAGMVGFSFPNAQYVFRTYYELVRDHGQKTSNWSALMSTCMLNSLLALDSSTERAAALQVYLTSGSSRQASLSYDYQHYTQPGDIYPESLQYSAAVGQIRSTHMVLLERYDPSLNLFGVYSNLPTSLPRISYLRYPNTSLQIMFGDGPRSASGHPYFRYELMYQHALVRGRTNLTALFGSLIDDGVASGAYNRSTLSDYSRLGQHDELLELLWQAPVVTEPAVTPELPRTDTLPWAGIALQRNPAPANHSTYGMMCFVGGAAHVHSHASGMSMELFGLGQVMGSKAGTSTYGSALHERYYRLYAANNTIIVNGASRGEGGWEGLAINTVQTVAMEPQPFAAAVSSNVSFTCSSFADNKGTLAEATQQRTLALIRTSPTSGFYVDFFRSQSTVTTRVATTLNGNVTNQFHDYLYHNIGSTNVSLTTNGVTLPLVSQPTRFQNDIGDVYDQPGWRYFTNTAVSYPHNQPVRAQFNASTLYMHMILPAVTNREYARVTCPPIEDYSSANSPGLVVRQIGEAWDKPFAVVYEPHLSASGSTVTNVTALWRGYMVVGLKIESVVGGQLLTHYVISNPNAHETYTDASMGLSFTGRFGIIADKGTGAGELYVGEGSSLAYRGNLVAAVGGTNTQASLLYTPGQQPVVTANGPVTFGVAAAPVFTQMVRSSDGKVTLGATGAPGVPYSLWTATNLASGAWSVVALGSVTNSPFVIEDATATNQPVRFYRFTTP